jgi:hypothetical protein
MSDWRLIDSGDGLSTYHKYDHVTKETTIWTVGDAEPGLEWAKALAKDDEYSKEGIKKEFWHYCHVPPSVLIKWHALGIDINRPEELIKMVNKPEWKYLKVTAGFHS